MSNRMILMLAGLFAVLLAGVSLGLHLRPAPPPAPLVPREVVKVVRVPESNPTEDYENYKLRRQVKELQTRVAAVRAAAAPKPSPEPPAPPRPVEFPRDAPPAYLPDGFRDVVDQVVKHCHMGLQVAKLDCSEYPCVVWTKATDASVHRFSMDDCAPWKQAFPNGEMVVGDSGPGDGGSAAQYFAWMPMPDEESRAAVMKRFKERRRDVEQELGIGN